MSLCLYKMELYKLCRRKSTWFTAGVVLLLMVSLFCRTYEEKYNQIREFGAQAGYRNAIGIMQYGLMFLSIWLIIVLAPILAEDNENSIKDIISSAQMGRDIDYFARVKAAFTISITSFITMTGTIIGVCGWVYGYHGSDMEVGSLYPYTFSIAPELSEQSIMYYLCHYLFLALGSVLMLTVLLILISAFSHTIVHALLLSVFIYFLPVAAENFSWRGSGNPGYIFITGQPILLVVQRYMEENWSAYWQRAAVIVIVIFAGIRYARKKWGKTKE